ncbi:hypothetical protein QF035_002406 [Streptomyces umbrinus]|uniref:Uncharacterized protein n=1 Tax=Streptomyces umbrinus TaxID=67370 RepID=A0ABU0SMN7_9ACTN|nr:hypothetical protein [Streptomyces umbrinus]MDQ1024824.1 hypothetical protein [Streptomyces umbrinus]
MRTRDGSWLITTEVVLEPEEHDPDVLPSVLARLTVIDTAVFFWEEVDRAPLLNYDSQKSKAFGKVLSECLVEVFRRAGYEQHAHLADAAYASVVQLPVPTFGSPPTQWTALGQFLQTTGTPGAAAISESLGAAPSITFMCVVGGTTLLLNISLPVAKALGRGLAYRVDQLLGTPGSGQAVEEDEPSS